MVLLTLTAYNNTQFTPSERDWVDPLVGLRRVGRVGSRFFIFWWVESTIAKVLKVLKDYVYVFKARSVKNMNKLMRG